MGAEVARKAYELVGGGCDIVVATIQKTRGSTPRHAGSIMVMSREGERWGSVGGGEVEAAVVERAQRAFDTRERCDFHFELRLAGDDALGMVCGGAVDISVEFFEGGRPEALQLPLEHPDLLYVFGAGHVGRALEPLARFVGFRVVMVDDRPECADPALFPEADAVVLTDSYERAFSDAAPAEGAYVVIMTSRHTSDLVVLRDALAAPCAYVGMMGSRKKRAFIFDALRREGVSDEALSRVHAPIGEDISAETPEELAVSVVAELIRVRADRTAR